MFLIIKGMRYIKKMRYTPRVIWGIIIPMVMRAGMTANAASISTSCEDLPAIIVQNNALLQSSLCNQFACGSGTDILPEYCLSVAKRQRTEYAHSPLNFENTDNEHTVAPGDVVNFAAFSTFSDVDGTPWVDWCSDATVRFKKNTGYPAGSGYSSTPFAFSLPGGGVLSSSLQDNAHPYSRDQDYAMYLNLEMIQAIRNHPNGTLAATTPPTTTTTTASFYTYSSSFGLEPVAIECSNTNQNIACPMAIYNDHTFP